MVIFGEILWDCFGQRRVLGGAPLNVAWNLTGFGLRPIVVSAVGDDALGQEALATMRKWGIPTVGVAVLPGETTGTVQIEVKDGEPSYEILVDVAYDQIPMPEDPVLEQIATAKKNGKPLSLYHGSLATRDRRSRQTLLTLKSNHNLDAFVDINIREPHFDATWAEELLRNASLVKLNEDELAQLTQLDVQDAASRRHAVEVFSNRISNQSTSTDNIARTPSVLLTLGEDGAELHRHGQSPSIVASPKPDPFVDAVGAGDAFSSVMLHAAMTGQPLDRAIPVATHHAARVCSLEGATTTDPSFYQLPKSASSFP